MKKILILISLFISSIGFSQTKINIDELEKLSLEKINQYRLTNGKTKLTLVDTISNSARKHSSNMVKNNYLFHEKSGYWHGENCGYIELSNGYKNYEEISNKIVSNWINSPLHKEALLRDGDNVGIGVSVSNNGRIYFTYRIYVTDMYFKKDNKLALDIF